MPRWCGQTKAKYTQPTLGSPGPFGTAEGRENMTTTPETSLEVNAGLHRACTACAKPRFHSLARNAPSVRSNRGKTHAINTWLSRPIWHCRGARNHDNDTGDVARGQRWFTPCMHGVRKAEFSLLCPKCPVGAVEPRQNTCNAHLALQGHLVLPRGPQKHDIDTGDVAGGQLWSITCAHRVCKAKFPLLDPKCPVGAV